LPRRPLVIATQQVRGPWGCKKLAGYSSYNFCGIEYRFDYLEPYRYSFIAAVALHAPRESLCYLMRLHGSRERRMGYIRDGEGIMNNCRRKKKKIGGGKKKKKIELFCPSSIRKRVVNKERGWGARC